MNRQAPTLLDRVGWLFPLRGRWLRYFILGVGSVLAALWCDATGFDLAGPLPTILSAPAGSVRWNLTESWGLGCSAGFSFGGHTVAELLLGPFRLSWFSSYSLSWPEQFVRFFLHAALAAAGLTVLWNIPGRYHRMLLAMEERQPENAQPDGAVFDATPDLPMEGRVLDITVPEKSASGTSGTSVTQ